MWLLGIELGTPGRAVSALTTDPSLQPNICYFFLQFSLNLSSENRLDMGAFCGLCNAQCYTTYGLQGGLCTQAVFFLVMHISLCLSSSEQDRNLLFSLLHLCGFIFSCAYLLAKYIIYQHIINDRK